MFGYLRHDYGNTSSTRPFAFVLPQVSESKRRINEIQHIPGGIDLVVADLSASWLWPARVEQEVTNLLLDVSVAAGREPVPRFLVLVSDPRARMCALRAVKDFEGDTLSGGRRTSISHHVGDRGGHQSAVGGQVGKLRIHAASTTEAEIQAELLDLAKTLLDTRTHARTAEAVRQAVASLSAMASSIAPPLADTEDPETTRTFVDAAHDVRTAMSEEGEPPAALAIHAALRHGEAAATRLMRNSPARLALDEARVEAIAGRRVAFVADSDVEARQAATSAPDGLLIVSRRTHGMEVAKHNPDLLVITCRGSDAMRILAEQSRPPADVVMLLQPLEAMTARRIAELVLDRPELDPAHALCKQVIDKLPPSFAHLPREAEFTSRVPRRKAANSLFEATRDGLHVVTEDGEETVFAPGATLITLVDGMPKVRRACDVGEGDSVVIIPQDMMQRITVELGWKNDAALIDEQVHRYKTRVREWRKGPGYRMTTPEIRALMRAAGKMDAEPSDAAIRYWISAGDTPDVAAPRASANPQWLAAFFKVIGLDDADRIFLHFGHHRGRLQRAGHVRSGLLERFLFDPYDAVVQRGVSFERAKELRQLAIDSARIVVSVELCRSGERN